MKQKALEYLERNSVLYMGMIFPIKRGSVDIIYAEKDGVFIKDAESGVYMLASDNFVKSKELLDAAGRQAHICFYQKATADYYHKKFKHKKYAINIQAVYTKTEYVELRSHDLDIRPLTRSHLDWVHDQNGHDHEYLIERLESGMIFGGYLRDELRGSVGVHRDGSIGMLAVPSEFRGRGHAFELEGYMVNTLLGREHMPFSQIEYNNDASIGLHKKLGFAISSDTIYRLID
jgi:ribosomal protein S18 acetylase RimI-like enzyme